MDEDDIIPLDGLLQRGERFHQDLRVVLLRLNQEKSALARHVETLVYRLDEVEQENKRLKSRVAPAQPRPSAPPLTVPPSEAPPDQVSDSPATVSTQEASVPYRDLLDKYNILRKERDKAVEEHHISKRQIEELTRANQSLQERWERNKATVKAWKAHNDRLQRKYGKEAFEEMKEEVEGSSASNGALSRQALVNQSRLQDRRGAESVHLAVPSSLLNGPFLPSPVSFVKPGVVEPKHADQVEGHSMTQDLPSNTTQNEPENLNSGQTTQDETQHEALKGSARQRSSQTTQDESPAPKEPTQTMAEQQGSDGDAPIVVSSRSLKRKHPVLRENGTFEVYNDEIAQGTTPGQPVRIKEECADSPIATQPPIRFLARGSTLDLDDVGGQTDTPRKRPRAQGLRNSQLQEVSLSELPALRHERLASLPPEFPDVLGFGDAAHETPQDENFPLEVPDSDPIAVREEDEETINNPTIRGTATAVLTRSPNNPRHAKVLRPVNANTRVLPPLSEFRPRRTRRRGDDGKAVKAIHMLSEDGEEEREIAVSPAVEEESRRLLNGLLEAPSLAKSIITSPITTATARPVRTTPKANVGEKSSNVTPQPQTATRSKKKSATPQLPTPQTSIRAPRTSPAQSLQSPQPPLRSKPVEQLNLSDFKINPQANAGFDFAFNEVVRDREARRCLPGCIKTECCGPAFRAMVEAGAAPTLPRNLWDDTQEDETEDDRFLKWHMGAAYNKERLAVAPEAQRQELLLRAKMKLLANQAGRHRQAFERSKTPPGFWRTDFPGTQELARDREEARQIERENVGERYNEAMREGGRWIFRDE